MTVSTPVSLRQLIARSDGHPALVAPGSGATLSYGATAAGLDRRRGGLPHRASGPATGSRSPPLGGPALIVAFLAVVASGAAGAPLNPALGAAELVAELDDLRVSRLLPRRGGPGRHRGG